MTDWQTGILAFREGRLREASDRLRRAADEQERTVTQESRYQTWAFLGAALYALGRAAEAADAFENAARLCPAPAVPPDLTVNLANAYLATGRRADARRALETTLQHAPGHVEARMLLNRLDSHDPNTPLSGAVLGESPEAARLFLRTLSFGAVAQGGYAPDQVREALGMLSHYIEFLAAQVGERDQTITQQTALLEQARQTENTLIDNLHAGPQGRRPPAQRRRHHLGTRSHRGRLPRPRVGAAARGPDPRSRNCSRRRPEPGCGRRRSIPMTDVSDTEASEPKTADAVLANLSQAESHARILREEWEQQKQTLQDAETRLAALQAQLVGAQETNTRLAQDVQAARREVEQERHNTDEQCAAVKAEAEQQKAALQAQADTQRARAAAQRARNKQLEAVLKELHATFYSGNVYALILKACLIITGATRGVYVTTRGGDSPLRIRAAIDVDGYPQSPPSDFLQALCRKVLADDETFLARTEEDLAALPEPKAPTEHFHNCLVAPVSLLANLSGIVICADKAAESFDDHDVESVLAVGNQATIAAENEHLRRQLQQAYLGTVSVMADAMEAKDSYTQGHSEMVSRHARLIARHLNLTEEERSIISYAALLHDIGKNRRQRRAAEQARPPAARRARTGPYPCAPRTRLDRPRPRPETRRRGRAAPSRVL